MLLDNYSTDAHYNFTMAVPLQICAVSSSLHATTTAIHKFLCYVQYLIKIVIILYTSSKGGKSTASLGIYDMPEVHSHAHMARNDTSHYLCHFHAESSIFMRCTIERSFIISWHDNSLLKGLSVCHFNDLQATCKKPRSNMQATAEALKARQRFWGMVDCSSTFGSSVSP